MVVDSSSALCKVVIMAEMCRNVPKSNLTLLRNLRERLPVSIALQIFARLHLPNLSSPGTDMSYHVCGQAAPLRIQGSETLLQELS